VDRSFSKFLHPYPLNDMHGNAAEWTTGVWSPPNAPRTVATRCVVRGGSWQDRPRWARSASRMGYTQWPRVVDVGFRIIVEE